MRGGVIALGLALVAMACHRGASTRAQVDSTSLTPGPSATENRPFAFHGEGTVLCMELRGQELACLGDLFFFEEKAGWFRGHRPPMVPRALASFGQLRSLSSSDYEQGCFVEADGLLSCWGGLASWAPVSPRGPYPWERLKAVDVSAAMDTACVVDEAGRVHCWGRPLCRDGPYASAPRRVEGVSAIVQVEVGHDMACALDREGIVVCWGALAPGSETCAPPKPVAGLEKVTQLGLGEDFTCVLGRSGAVSCWGENRSTTLGRRGAPSTRTPTVVPGVRAVQLAVEDDNVCARAEDGRVWCWGSGFDEQDPSEPIATSAVDVFAGDGFACIAEASGDVHCFGDRTGRWPDTDLPLERWRSAPALWLGYTRPWVIHQALAQGLYESEIGASFRGAMQSRCARMDCSKRWPDPAGPGDSAWTEGWLRDVARAEGAGSLKLSTHQSADAYTLRAELDSHLTPQPVTLEYRCRRSEPEFMCEPPSRLEVIVPKALTERIAAATPPRPASPPPPRVRVLLDDDLGETWSIPVDDVAMRDAILEGRSTQTQRAEHAKTVCAAWLDKMDVVAVRHLLEPTPGSDETQQIFEAHPCPKQP